MHRSLARNVQPSLTRSFSASTRPIKTARYIDILHRETKDPIWRLLDTLHAPTRRLELSQALFQSGVSIDDFRRWKPVVYEPNIAAALRTLNALGFQVTLPPEDAPDDAAQYIPTWVVFYLIGFKVRTPTHANGPLLDLLYTYLDAVPPSSQGPLLVFTMLHLARFELVLPMFRVLDTFLTTPVAPPALHFNLMLQAIAQRPTRSVENAKLAVSLLKAMDARQLPLRPDTYETLLNDRFVTLQLTKHLQERIVREGHVPTASELEAFLRVFARDGAIHDAQRYFDAIHARPPDHAGTGDRLKDTANEPQYRANTLFLAAHEDRGSAFTFLRRLTAKGEDKPDSPPARHGHPRPSRLVHRQHVDAYDYTATLSVAARDLSTSPQRLIQLFERMPVRPTIATYTVLLRGLLWRENYALAAEYWSKLLHAGLPMDKEALTAGFQVLVRAGKPNEAFALLEKYARREPLARVQLHKPVRLSVIAMNECLVVLNRVQRPDVVFRLWDHMGTLYGVHPNAMTLSIVLQAARIAYRMDDTFSGVVKQLALKNPFRRRKPVGLGPVSRAEAVGAVVKLLGRPGGPPKPYASGIWHAQPPIDAARTVFLQALFGAFPDGRLLHVHSPADAVRPSISSDTSLVLPALKPAKYTFTPPPALLTPQGTSQHPHIRVTNANCFNYLVLLGLVSRAPEIPLVLAWMRAGGLQPSESTLALALVFWGEVSLQAPLVEVWAGGRERSEYVRLVEWIKEWVGEERVPGERMLGKWRHVVMKMREKR